MESQDEADLPAFEPRAEAPPWVPVAHGHKGRAQDHQRTSLAWPEKAVGLSHSLRRI